MVDIVGSMDGNVLVLDECFIYLLGEGFELRIWRIMLEVDGIYIG